MRNGICIHIISGRVCQATLKTQVGMVKIVKQHCRVMCTIPAMPVAWSTST